MYCTRNRVSVGSSAVCLSGAQSCYGYLETGFDLNAIRGVYMQVRAAVRCQDRSHCHSWLSHKEDRCMQTIRQTPYCTPGRAFSASSTAAPNREALRVTSVSARVQPVGPSSLWLWNCCKHVSCLGVVCGGLHYALCCFQAAGCQDVEHGPCQLQMDNRKHEQKVKGGPRNKKPSSSLLSAMPSTSPDRMDARRRRFNE